jgi:predicted metal-dependent phosphoesterase TrpH
MKKTFLILLVLLFITGISIPANGQFQNEDVYEFPEQKQMKLLNYRQNIILPDLEGFETLKCDFHMHTVFSDGQVWPSMRVIEAWTDGLDAVALTDHIGTKHKRNKDILMNDQDNSFEIARKKGEELGILVVKGGEITYKKPFGHINALFLKEIEKLAVGNEMDAVDEAVRQGAYLFLNHPGWPNDTSTLYPVHRELIAQKKLHGVEVFNGSESYPKALDWCDEYGLAYFSNTDLHFASANSYREKLQRPMTLVFAKNRSVDGIQEALVAGRTLAWFSGNLAGKEELLREFVQKSIAVKVIDPGKGIVEVLNKTDIPYAVRYGNYMYSIPLPANQILRLTLPQGTEVLFTNCHIRQDKQFTMKLW